MNFRLFFHVLQHFGHRPYPEFRKWWKIPNMLCAVLTFLLKIWYFFKIWKSNFFQLAESYKTYRQIFNPKHRSRDKIRNVKSNFRFSGFPYINLLRKYYQKDFIKDFESKSGKSEIWLHVSNFISRSIFWILKSFYTFCSSRQAEKSLIFKFWKK